MLARAHSFARWSFIVALSLFAFGAFGGLAACGRSTLNDYIVLSDGGPTPDGDFDAPPPRDGQTSCNASTCPVGCCDESGVCQLGQSATSCGRLGAACEDCVALGFTTCDPGVQACSTTQPTCGPDNCPGCCSGNTCFQGSDATECGGGGNACQDCATTGLACEGGACIKSACGPETCPGCCFGGECLLGTEGTACGEGGQQCANCVGMNETCATTGQGGTCVAGITCGPSSCPGCCTGNTCVVGLNPGACGASGQQCVDCSLPGDQCVPAAGGGICVTTTTCGPENCPGCCSGNECTFGTAPGACGELGQQCADCSGPGEQCVAVEAGIGGLCEPTNGCNPATCPSGCCAGAVCATGTQPDDCGSGGQACQDCLSLGEVCTNQQCIVAPPPPPCGPSTCAGCCDGNGVCQAGFLDNQCGEGGAGCADCQSMGSTCDTGANPRTCESQCPQTYAGCGGSVTTPVPPTIPGACSASDLANAAVACAAGASGSSALCATYFQTVSAGCAACLAPFDFDFDAATGIAACIAPQSSDACNHDTGCISDCVTKSCAACDASSQQSCDNQALMGQCAQFLQTAAQVCNITQLCSPATYGGSFGRWLQGVGGQYCGP